MQGSQISQLIQMVSIGMSDTTPVDSAVPSKWRIVGSAPRDLGRMICSQRTRTRTHKSGGVTHRADVRFAPEATYLPHGSEMTPGRATASPKRCLLAGGIL
jgi:hypothetical protein